MTSENVILVDELDTPVGTLEKLEAHRKGLLHRAFSIFVFNSNNELMLQQRAKHKYHSGGLWTNTCCSHQREGETTLQAAKRRLDEEMGFNCEMEESFSFIYKTDLDNEMTEHEFDHVVIGHFDGVPTINPEEVEDYKYVDLEWLTNDIAKHPEHYTVWFKIALPEVVNHLKKNSQ